MCGRRRDPKIDEQLEKQRAEAEAAKKAAQEELEAQKAASLAQAKEQLPLDRTITEGQLDRQAENIYEDTTMKNMAALRRAARAGGKGRRSLLTAKTGQGYFSRFGV